MSDKIITDENLIDKKTYARLLSILSDNEIRMSAVTGTKTGKIYFVLSLEEITITDSILCNAINRFYEAKKTKSKEIVIDGVVYIPKELNDE